MSLTQKELEYHRAYRAKNREKLKAYQNQWAENNRDKTRASSKKWNLAHPEQRKEITRNHVKANPEKNAEKTRRYRARLKGCQTFLILDKEIARLYASPCAGCGSMEKQTIDHRIPIARGGSNGIGNLQTLCRSCNSGKRHKTVMEWRMFNIKNYGK